MVLFNYSTKELTAKIVYYGPGLCGKTTNLQFIYKKVPSKTKGKMISLATKTDRTLFFDFLPLELGTIGGLRTRFQLYTVPGQVFYNSTRKLVLKGADAVVFVADSQKRMMPANIESLENLRENLKDENIELEDLPMVFQYNKRDLTDIATIEELNQKLNTFEYPYVASCAITGEGVLDTLKTISKITLEKLAKKYASRRSNLEQARKSKPASAKFTKIERPITQKVTKVEPELSPEEQAKIREQELKEREQQLKEVEDLVGDSSKIKEQLDNPQPAQIKEEQAAQENPVETQTERADDLQQEEVNLEDSGGRAENAIQVDGENHLANVVKKAITAPIHIPKGTRIKDITFEITLNIKVVTEEE